MNTYGYGGENFLHLNCCHLSKVYDDASQTVTPEFSHLLGYVTPSLLLLTETKLADIQVALRAKTALGFAQGSMAFTPGGAPGTPGHGLLAIWKYPLQAHGVSHGIDWILIDFGHGFKLAYVYSAPGDRCQHFIGHVTAWAMSCSRLLLVGDINPVSNGRASVPTLLGAGLARLPCPATTRGSRPNRQPADEVWCHAPYARLLVAGVLIRPQYHCLSDYHWPVTIRLPRIGFLHRTQQPATWRSRMIAELNGQFSSAGDSLSSLVASIQAMHPRRPTSGLQSHFGNLTNLFYKSPTKYANVLFGSASATAYAPLSQRDRADILARANTRYTGNPPLSAAAIAEFLHTHVDPFYPVTIGTDRACDRELLAPVQADELHATLAELRDAATQDLGFEAMITVLATCAGQVAQTFSSWIAAGHCLEPRILALAYQIIAKRGQMTPAQHRVIVIEQAFGRLWFKLLERRLRHALESRDVLSSNNVAFCSDRSATEVLICLKSLIDSERPQAPCYVATADWPSAYDFMNWGLLPAIGERIMGARGFFDLLVRCFQAAPRALHLGPDDIIGPLAQAFNGGPQGNCVVPLSWNIYVDPLARALKRQDPPLKPASSTIFCDDTSAYRQSLEEVQNFFNTVDAYVLATGSPLGTKNFLAANFAGSYIARTHYHIIHLPKNNGPPVRIEGSITLLGACVHLDAAAPCSLKTCKYCNALSSCKVCDQCIGSFLLNLKSSPLSPLNRASMIKCYVINPLLQQMWLCPKAKQRLLSWRTGPGRHMGIRNAMHNNPIGGPWNESLELDVRLGGAGLGNLELTLAKTAGSEFVRCAYGPTEIARAVTTLWHRNAFTNKVVRESLVVLKGSLLLRNYPHRAYLDRWRFAREAAPQLEGKTVLVTWTRPWGTTDAGEPIWAVAVATQGMVPESIGVHRLMKLVCVRDRDEAELAAIWGAISLGDHSDTHVIASTPQAVARITRYRSELPRKRRKLAYGLFLESIAQSLKVVVSVEACGASLEWLLNLGVSGDTTSPHMELPPYIVKLTLPHAGVRHDRLHSALNAECKELSKHAVWERMQASLGDASYRVPIPGGAIRDLGWAQSARVLFTKQTKLACRSPLAPGDVTRILNLRYAGYHKRAIMITTQCIFCGPPYTLTHILGLPRYVLAVDHVTTTYGPTLLQYGVPLWWRDWQRPDGPLLTALGWVPGTVEQAVAQYCRDKATHSLVAEAVLDAQLHLVQAFLAGYAEHSPADARPPGERRNGPDADAESGAHSGPIPVDAGDALASPLVARASRRAQGRPAIHDMREKYKIRERVLVLFDGAARKTCSGSSVVIIVAQGTSTDVYRFAYKHPSHRNPSVGERIGFVLGVLALRKLRLAVRGTTQAFADDATIAWIGDNETLMRQVGTVGTPNYRSREDMTRRVTAWLRAHIGLRDGVYHVHREYNWMSDEAANTALDAWVRVRAQTLQWSTEFGDAQAMIAAVEETWREIFVLNGQIDLLDDPESDGQQSSDLDSAGRENSDGEDAPLDD